MMHKKFSIAARILAIGVMAAPVFAGMGVRTNIRWANSNIYCCAKM
ncbi:MAG: hypothetical protein PHU34_08430 [Candidatus Methanoperedens sp.]|nr:hypothetical protein [Candidatus Methanoperedens sp.]